MNANKISGEMTGEENTGREVTSKKQFPIGWLLTAAALSFFVGHFWSYLPVVRGIVSLLVFSKFLAGLSGTHLLL